MNYMCIWRWWCEGRVGRAKVKGGEPGGGGLRPCSCLRLCCQSTYSRRRFAVARVLEPIHLFLHCHSPHTPGLAVFKAVKISADGPGTYVLRAASATRKVAVADALVTVQVS